MKTVWHLVRRTTIGLPVVMALAACAGGGGARSGGTRPTSPRPGGTTSAYAGGSPVAPVPSGTAATPATGRGGSPASAHPAADPHASPRPTAADAALRSIAVPPAGRYVYAARGWVESTVGATTERRDLPPVVQVDVRHTRAGGTIEVVVDATLDDRLREQLRLSYRRDDVHLTGFSAEKQHGGGVPHTHDVVPDPPVLFERVPATPGQSWEIAWYDRAIAVEGTGRGRVARWETVRAGGRSVRALVIEVRQTFTGSVSGGADFTLWLDPASGVFVKLSIRNETRSTGEVFRDEVNLTLERSPA